MVGAGNLDGMVEVVEQHIEGCPWHGVVLEMLSVGVPSLCGVGLGAHLAEHGCVFFEVLGGFCARDLIDIDGIEVDHDHAAVLRQRAKHVVPHVARMVRDGAHRRVGRDDGRAGHLQRVEEGLVGHVRNVDQHPHSVHLDNDLAAKVSKPVVHGLRSFAGPRRVRECRME